MIQVLADADYRFEAVVEQRQEQPAELIVALGREGKANGEIDAKTRPLSAAMAKKFKTVATQTADRKRKWLSEPPTGWIKCILGFRQFSMRGLIKAQAAWKLVCTAFNLRRMAKMMTA